MSNKKELPTANSVLNKVNRNVFALQRSEALEAMEEYATIKCEELKEENALFKKAFADATEAKVKLKEENDKLRDCLERLLEEDMCSVAGIEKIQQALNKEG